MTASSPGIDPRAAREAAQWLVRLQAEGGDAARMPELVLGKLGAAQAEDGMAMGSLSAGVLRMASRAQRRAATRLLALAIMAGPAGYAAWRLAPWNEWSADIRTATGERRVLSLPDGSRMQLDTGSAVDLAFSASERRVILRSGAVWIQTAHDATGRPFLVQTPQGSARALGTRFTVRVGEPQQPQTTLVAVQQGAVELRPAGATGAGGALRIEAGSQARMTGQAVGPAEPAGLGADGWVRGVLYAEQMPLAAFAAELARYRVGLVRCDPAVAHLPVSGAFQLRDTDEALVALVASLSVKVSLRTRYWVTIGPR